MKQLFLFCIFLLIAGFIRAQGINIRGDLYNLKNNSPVAEASIMVYNVQDSSIVKTGLSAADGSFRIENVTPGKYFLEISSVGYSNYQTEELGVGKTEDVNLGKIFLHESSQMLDGIVISAKRPLIQHKADKLVFNVASSLSAATSSALDILEKAPGVTVDKDGNISLRGKSGVVVLIDDRPTYMSNADLASYLKGLPASSLSQLEIMTNPSAKYDAAGNSGVINIITKKTKSDGFNSTLTSSLSYADKISGHGNLNFNLRKGKVNVFGNYSYTNDNSNREQTFFRAFKDAGTKNIVSTFDQSTHQSDHDINNNLKLGLDYYAGKNTTAGFVFTGFYDKDNFTLWGDSWFKGQSNERDSGITTKSQIIQISKNLSFNTNLRHNFNSSGAKMTTDLDYIVYNNPQTTSLATNYFLPDGSEKRPSTLLTGDLPSLIKIYSGKIDFIIPLKHIGEIQTGLKASHVRTDNNAMYENSFQGHQEADLGKSNHFIYNENIQAAYISWNKQIKKWGFQVGLRSENTQSSGHQLGNAVVKDSSFTKHYLNFFPSAYLTFNADNNNTFGVNFGRRIQRPDYSSLNPFFFFIDEYTYQAGNVFLQPQFTNRVELTHNFKSLLHSSVSYSHTAKAITQIIRQDIQKKIIYQTNDNVGNQSGITFSSGINLKTGRHLATNLDMILDYEKYEGQISPDYYLKSAKWMYTAKINEQADFGKGWSGELSGFYITPQVYGQASIGRIWRADGSLQKKMMHDKGSVGFSVRDIFQSQKSRFQIVNNGIDIRSVVTRPAPKFSISFKYSFGKAIKGLKRYDSGSASDEQNRVGKN